MKAQQLQIIATQLHAHAMSALRTLYKSADLGENRLELNEHTVDYSDGADFTITALDYTPHAVMALETFTYFQDEDGGPTGEENDVANLPLETLLKLLAAVEARVEWHDNSPFIIPEERDILRIMDIERETLRPATLNYFKALPPIYMDTTNSEHIYHVNDIIENINGGHFLRPSDEVMTDLYNLNASIKTYEAAYIRITKSN